MKRKIIVGLVLIFIVLQFFRIDKSPMVVESGLHIEDELNVPEDVRHLLKSACYDCHSALTHYPWYSDIAPISFWMKKHVNNGQKHLNFSLWSSYSEKKKAHKIEETIEMLDKKWMPILSYKLGHSEARLSNEQYKTLIDYFKSI